MNIFRKILKTDYSNLLFAGFIMCISTILMIHDALFFKFNIYILIVINCVIWLCYCKIFKNKSIVKIRKISTKEIILTLIGIGYVIFLFELKLKEVILLIWSFLFSSLLYIFGLSERLEIVEEIILMLILMVLINFLYYLLIKNLVNVRIFLFVIIYFVSQWNRYIDSSTLYLVIFLFGIILYVLFKNNYIFCIKNYSGTLSKGSQFIFGILLTIVIMSFSHLIVKVIPLDYLNDKMGSLVPDVSFLRDGYTHRGGNRYFDLNSTIYQPNPKKLGGSISLDKSVKLIVETSLPGTKLRGSVKDTYTGVEWLRSKEVIRDFEPKFLDLSLFKVKVNPVGIYTSTLLTPLNTTEVKVNSGKVEKNDEDILRHNNSIIGKKLKEYTAYSLLKSIDSNLTDMEKEKYLQLPDNYSKEVIDLTLEITKNEKGKKEKAEAIQYFLRNNYIYSLEVDDYGNEDFVEYFLFEGKKGYCTYFATSMVIMSRIVDIPARYVEGFILPEQKSDKGIYKVTGDRAHAWPELYIEGLGWTSFEPTPAYNQETYTENIISDQLKMENLIEESLLENIIESEREQPKINVNYLSSVLLLLICAGASILIVVVICKKRNDKVMKLDTTEKKIVTSKIYRIFKLGDICFKGISEYKRPEQKMKSILEKIHYIEVDESVIINAMNITLFSEKEININNRLVIEGVEQALEKHLKENVNILRYTIYKYKVSG